MKKLGIYFLISALCVFKMQAQENAITTAAPFLLIVPDARSGGAIVPGPFEIDRGGVIFDVAAIAVHIG